MKTKPINRVIAYFGTQHAMAKALGVSRQAIHIMSRTKTGYIPPYRVPEVARLTGIPRHELNPISHEID
jgi:DNA-binding transcriptional regulator YdaS (Cro superfamily)